MFCRHCLLVCSVSRGVLFALEMPENEPRVCTCQSSVLPLVCIPSSEQKFYLFIYESIYLWGGGGVCTCHCAHVKVGGQFVGVSSFPRWTSGIELGMSAWQQVPFSTEPPCRCSFDSFLLILFSLVCLGVPHMGGFLRRSKGVRSLRVRVRGS